MAVTNKGYTELLNYIKTNWNYVALVNSTGTELTRIAIESNDWTVGADYVMFQKSISGSTIGVGNTVQYFYIYNEVSDVDTVATASISPVTINSVDDILNIKITFRQGA